MLIQPTFRSKETVFFEFILCLTGIAISDDEMACKLACSSRDSLAMERLLWSKGFQ
jgi:hypothetical protein